MRTFLFVLFCCLALISCRKEDTIIKENNDELIGSWVNPQYNDTLITYDRAENLVENQYGITFKQDNTLVLRQNSGWCGTPPIVTADYEGTWASDSDTVTITAGYWGGTSTFKWRIISLRDQKLVVSSIN